MHSCCGASRPLNAYKSSFKNGKVFGPAGESLPLDSNVSLEEATNLYSVVRQLKPSVSVEVGFAKGVSTLAILQALADNGHGVHHVIDPFQSQFGNAGLEMVRRAGLESNFQFYETFAENVVSIQGSGRAASRMRASSLIPE